MSLGLYAVVIVSIQPYVMQIVPATVILKTSQDIRVYALDEEGRRGKEVGTERVESGVRFRTGLTPTPVFEIILG